MRLAPTLLLALLALPLSAASKPNVLFLCIDDLRPDLHCYGVQHIHSPNIDRLAQSGRLFTRHYVQAPTCGASRYAMLTACYGPGDNEALFKAAASKGDSLVSLPGHFRRQGYTTVSVGKISHHPGGRGGAHWNDESMPEMPGAWTRHLMPYGEWQHPEGAMHGLAHGEIRKKAGDMAVYQSVEGADDLYPDGLITRCALEQLDALGQSAKQDQPFLLAIGWLKPHLPFGAPAKYMDPYRGVELPPIPHPQKPAGITTWHESWELRKYKCWGRDIYKDLEFQNEVRRHYAACISYADAQVGIVMEKLRQLNLAENTIVVVWGDHGWHLGEHAIWGKHSLFEEALRAPLIISQPGMPQPGVSSDAITETIDIFPTLCELSGVATPAGIDGQSLAAILKDPQHPGATAISYWQGAQTIRTSQYRLIRHHGGKKAGATELYDHLNEAAETVNLAPQAPELVKQLSSQLDAQLDSQKKR